MACSDVFNFGALVDYIKEVMTLPEAIILLVDFGNIHSSNVEEALKQTPTMSNLNNAADTAIRSGVPLSKVNKAIALIKDHYQIEVVRV